MRYDPSLDFAVRGPGGISKLAAVLDGGLSDIAMPVGEVIAEDGRRLARLRFQGRHTGAFQGSPATGKPVDLAVMDDVRVIDGRLVEHRALMDNLSLLERLGAVQADGRHGGASACD